MAILRIEKFPDDLYRELKIKAATEGTTVKAIVIGAAEKAVGRKAAAK
jgi:plasmid stability protein